MEDSIAVPAARGRILLGMLRGQVYLQAEKTNEIHQGKCPGGHGSAAIFCNINVMEAICCRWHCWTCTILCCDFNHTSPATQVRMYKPAVCRIWNGACMVSHSLGLGAPGVGQRRRAPDKLQACLPPNAYLTFIFQVY